MKTMLQKVGRVILNAPLEIFTTARHGGLRISRPTALLLPVFLLIFLAPAARAQWQTTTYTLKGGWNSIYLHGDATHATIDTLFAANTEVIEIWRWNPNPNATQFESSPLIPSAGTPEWTKWVRGSAEQTTLASLTGRHAYLVRCTGTTADTYTVSLTQKTLPPGNSWVRNGANLLGFPSRNAADTGTYPFFSTYFATFPAAISANTRVYKYVGGDLGAGNPVQVFSPATERLDRNQAYWFEAPVVSNFYAPLEISPSNLSGLHYGRNGALLTVRIRNRTAAAVTVTVAPAASASAPVGQTDITGSVPLTRRTFNSATSTYTETALGSGFNEVVGPQSSVELSFGLDRALVTGSADALYASFLRFTDGGNLLDVYLPASAQVTSLAGLWVGDVAISGVESKAPGYTGTTTGRSFPLRTLLHIDNAGTARLLSQVFLGKLAPSPHNVGLCTRETGLLATDKARATRLVAAHLPLDTEVATGSGSVGLGTTLVRTLTVPYNDRTNPFVHQYHPDHDNKDARFQSVGADVESYTITRTCSFTFTATPPGGVSLPGWGSSILGGTYTETLTGLHRQPIVITGTFTLRRASEIGAITLN
jgi:hypothetical protein